MAPSPARRTASASEGGGGHHDADAGETWLERVAAVDDAEGHAVRRRDGLGHLREVLEASGVDVHGGDVRSARPDVSARMMCMKPIGPAAPMTATRSPSRSSAVPGAMA